MKKLRIFYMFAALLVFFLWDCSGKDRARSGVSFPDSIVDDELLVMVNNYPIRGRDVRVFASMSTSAMPGIQSSREYNEILMEKYIRRILIWQEAVALSISVEDSTVQAALLELTQSMGGEAAFSRLLADADIDRENLIQSIQRDLVIREFLATQFLPNITVGEEDARRFYDQNVERFYSPDSVRAQHILLLASAEASDSVRDQKRSRIGEILDEVRAGADFAQLAQRYSEGPSKSRGGDLGYFVRGAMVQPFDSAAFALEPGEVSGIVTTRYGYHIIRVVDRKSGRFMQFAEVKDSLVYALRQQTLAHAVQNHLKELHELAIIEKRY